MIKNRVKKILSIILILIIVFTDNAFASTIIDLTNGITGTAPEHSHIWNYKYTNTKHWEECSVCNIKRNETTHTLTGNGGSKVLCENGYNNKAYREVCATCGYQSSPQVVLHGRYENYITSRRLNYGNMKGVKLDNIKQITYSEYSSLLNSYEATTDAPGGQSYTWKDDDSDGLGWVFCGGPVMSDSYGTKGTVAMIVGSEGDYGRKNVFDEYFALARYIYSDSTPTRTEFVTYLNTQINKSTTPTRHLLYGYNTKYNSKVNDTQFNKLITEFKGYYTHTSGWGWGEMNIQHKGHDNAGNSVYNDNRCYDSSKNLAWSTTNGKSTVCDLCGAKYNGSESYVNTTWFRCDVGNEIRTTPGVTRKCNGHKVYGKLGIHLGTVYCTFTNSDKVITRTLSIVPGNNCTGALSSTAVHTLPRVDTPTYTSWAYVYSATFTYTPNPEIKRTIECGYHYILNDDTHPVAYNHSGNTTNNDYWQVIGNGTADKMSTQASVLVTFKDPTQYSKNILKVKVYDNDKETIIKQSNGDEYIPLTKLSSDESLWQGYITINTEIYGSKDIYIQAIDSTGLKSELIPMQISYLDSTGPKLDVKVNENEWTSIKTVDVLATDISDVSIGVSEEDLTYISGETDNKKIYSFTGDVYDKENINFYGLDSAGNLSYTTTTIEKLDNTPPTITNINQEQNENINTFTIEANDINTELDASGSGIKEYAIAKEGEEPTQYQKSNVFKVKDEGNYVFYVKDNVGLITMSDTYTVKINNNVTINIIWDDEDNKNNSRPETYTLNIIRNDKIYETREISSDITTYTFNDIPFYDKEGNAYTYTYSIITSNEYKNTLDNNTFTCTFINPAFEISIPKKINLDTKDWNTEYKINVKGDMLEEDMISIVPDSNFVMTNTEGEEVVVSINQDITGFTPENIINENGQESNGFISSKLPEGTWSGNFKFYINYNNYHKCKNVVTEYLTTFEGGIYNVNTMYNAEIQNRVWYQTDLEKESLITYIGLVDEDTVLSIPYEYNAEDNSSLEVVQRIENIDDTSSINVMNIVEDEDDTTLLNITGKSSGNINITLEGNKVNYIIFKTNNSNKTDYLKIDIPKEEHCVQCKHQHIYKKNINIKNTCIEDGIVSYSCECGKTFSRKIHKTGHNYESEITTEPTCTTAGIKTFTCHCGHVYTEEIDFEHEWELIEEVKVTCTTDGTKSYKCNICNETKTEITNVALGHNYEETIINEVTCTEDGEVQYICKNCNDTYNKTIESTGHELEELESEANCTDNGFILTLCKKCDYNSIEITEQALGHEYESEITKEPTCTELGVKTYTCIRCDDYYEEDIEMLPHTIINGGTKEAHTKCSVCDNILSSEHIFTSEITLEPTCTEKGIRTYTCECGYTYNEDIEALGHNIINAGTEDIHTKCGRCDEILDTEHIYTDKVTLEPTCTEKGIRTYTCECGYTYDEDIEALGHIEVNGGTKESHIKCERCDKILNTEHTYTDKITLEPTCTEKGIRTYTCECGYTYDEDIEALGHIEVDGGRADAHIKCERCDTSLSSDHIFTDEVTKEPTCTESGIRTYTCECGYTYDENIEALGHIEINGGTKDIHVKCERCDETLSSTHNFTYEILINETCLEDGLGKYTCDCGYNYTEIRNKLGHDVINVGTEDVHTKCGRCDEILSTEHEFTHSITTAETCTTDGVDTYTCSCGYYYTETRPMLGHIEVDGGRADAHTKCERCDVSLSTAHTYTKTIEIEATCTTKGTSRYTCSCGYYYTSQDIEALGHVSVNGGTASVHTKCSRCGVTLSSTHSYTKTTQTAATCTTKGTSKYTCSCGYYYTSQDIAALGHASNVYGGTAAAHYKCSRCGASTSTAHSYTMSVTAKATTSATGTRKFTCACGYSYTEAIPIFANASWSYVLTAANSSYGDDYWPVGSPKNLTISGTSYQFVILGFNHDTKTAGGTANMTLGMTGHMGTRVFHSSNTNTVGWDGSTMRTYLRGLESSIESTIGNTSAIKAVNKKTTAGNKSTSIETTSETVFLLARVETTGTSATPYCNEGTRYEYYQTKANRVKGYKWWCRSPYQPNATQFYVVNADGNAEAEDATASNYVRIAFCL